MAMVYFIVRVRVYKSVDEKIPNLAAFLWKPNLDTRSSKKNVYIHVHMVEKRKFQLLSHQAIAHIPPLFIPRAEPLALKHFTA